jgi:hypothetical protein
MLGIVKYETLSKGEVSKTRMVICGVFWLYNKRINIPPVQRSFYKNIHQILQNVNNVIFLSFIYFHDYRIWHRVSWCVGTNVTEELVLLSSGYILRQPEGEAASCTVTLVHIQQSTGRRIAEDFSSTAVRKANIAFIHFA